MSTPQEPDWVRQGTPRDVDAEWNDEQSEYGTTVSPVEWDDYSSEQSVPVERPRPVAQPPVAARSADEVADEQPVADEATQAAASDEATDETSDDAAEFGAPLEDQPVLPEDAAEDSTVDPVAADQPVEDSAPEEPTLHEPAEEVAPETGIPAPVGVPGFERPEDEAPAESFEEETLDEPAIDDYDEPGDDAPVAADADPYDEPLVSDEPVAEDESAVTDEPVAEDVVVEEELTVSEEAAPVADTDPEGETLVEETDVVEEEVVDEPGDDYDPDATRVTPAVDTTDEDAEAADEDPDATRVVPVAVGAAGAASVAGASPIPDDLYRTGETAVIDDREALAARAREADEAEARERELQAQLDAERRARDERLGVVATSSENEVRDPATAYKVSTDRFFGSLGLFVLRLVTAAILGVTGYQVLTGVDRTTEFLSQTAIPEPRLVTWIVGFTLGALALLLVIGLIQRVVGVVLLLLSIGSLVFIRWGAFSPFVDGREGFLGDKTLLLAAVGFVLIGVGGGLWGVDGAFRRARAAAKAEKS
ncbi:hypothetical protein GCM10028820_15570 [Tessaracoccus terricola]